MTIKDRYYNGLDNAWKYGNSEICNTTTDINIDKSFVLACHSAYTNVLEIPSICRGYCDIFYNPYMIVYLQDSGFMHTKTIEDALGNGFNTPSFKKIQRFKTPKVEFYAGKGIILDKDMNPLMLCTMGGSIKGIDPDHLMVDYTEYCIHLSKKVLLENNPLHTNILKKIIPYYLNFSILYDIKTDVWDIKTMKASDAKIKVGMIDNFFNRTQAPETHDLNGQCNDVLNDNINEILNLIK